MPKVNKNKTDWRKNPACPKCGIVPAVGCETPGYAFQYFAEGKMVEDTGLITKEEAESLWNKYESHFIKQVEWQDEAEMAIWEDMEYEGDYHKQMRHVRSQDVLLKDGIAYTLEPVF